MQPKRNSSLRKNWLASTHQNIPFFPDSVAERQQRKYKNQCDEQPKNDGGGHEERKSLHVIRPGNLHIIS